MYVGGNGFYWNTADWESSVITLNVMMLRKKIANPRSSTLPTRKGLVMPLLMRNHSPRRLRWVPSIEHPGDFGDADAFLGHSEIVIDDGRHYRRQRGLEGGQ